MFDRKPFVRLGLRKLARKNPGKRDDIKEVLRDSDLFEALVAESAYVAEYQYGVGEDGGLINFLNWFIEHADEIFAIISKLIALFAEVDE